MNGPDFCNVLYYVLPALSRMLHAAEQERNEHYNKERVDALIEVLDEVVNRFAQTKEGAGLRNTEAVCALMVLAGYVADAQVINHEVTRRNMAELDKRFINDLFAQMTTTAKPN